MDVLSTVRKQKFDLPENLSIAKLWNLISPTISKEVAPNLLPISNLMDTNAFEIGYIFVQTQEESSCFGSPPLLKVLGPIRNFVEKSATSPKWLANEFPVDKEIPNHKDFRVTIQHNGEELFFEGQDYYFLHKSDDMVVERNVIINRRAEKDLHYARWFGLIRDVLVTKNFQLKVETKESGRTLYIGDKEHVILFDYELYKIDTKGKPHLSSCSLPNLPWEGLQCECQDGLPLPLFE